MSRFDPNPLTLNSLLTLPVVKALAFGGTLITAGWMAAHYLHAIEDGIRNTTLAVHSVRDEVSRMRAEVYTRSDHRMWSMELERANSGKISVPIIAVPTGASPK